MAPLENSMSEPEKPRELGLNSSEPAKGAGLAGQKVNQAFGGPGPKMDAEIDAGSDPDLGPDDEPLARQQALGDRLRQLFEHMVEEPVPDDFKELLAKLTDDPPTLDQIRPRPKSQP